MAKYLQSQKLQQMPVMKKEHPIRTLLGITQEEIAMLLGVSRGQWSMFEIGKRDLPLPAKQLLAEMLAYVQISGPNAKQTPQIHQPIRQQLERLLHENEYQQARVLRKIDTATKKYEAQLRLQQLSNFLENRLSSKQAPIGSADMLAVKILKIDQAQTSAVIVQQEHQLELLQFERSLLEKKLKSLS